MRTDHGYEASDSELAMQSAFHSDHLLLSLSIASDVRGDECWIYRLNDEQGR